MPTQQEIADRCQALFDDLSFAAAREWKEAEEGRKVIGYMPIYVPREIIHAAGMLPLGVLGGGDQLEVIHGDAYYQSYICRIPRSTIELGVTGRLDFVDGMLFPSICDVIRNLSGMWKLMFPDKYVRYFDVPQNFEDKVGGAYYVFRTERTAARPREDRRPRDYRRRAPRVHRALYNENRNLTREPLYAFRAREPWKIPSSEVYLVMRAGMVLPVEEHNRMLRDYLDAAANAGRPMRDNCRILTDRRLLRAAAPEPDQVHRARRVLRRRRRLHAGEPLAAERRAHRRRPD